MLFGKRENTATDSKSKKTSKNKNQSKGKKATGACKHKTSMDELQELIGLSEAKKIIGQASAYAKMQLLCKERGIPHKPISLHMLFTGNPGTAKTTVARLTAKILKESGFLSKGDLIEVGRCDLVGKYLGWTAKQVQEKFKEAEGSVLFIDEAYALVDDRAGSYGDEAINTIVQEMENHRNDMVVIFAGYRKPMEHFLECNEGLNSRIAFRVNFPNYSEEELMQILRKIVRENGREISIEAAQAARELICRDMSQPGFGNGRYVRRLVERAMLSQASRLMSNSQDEDEISNHDLRFISPEDFNDQGKDSTDAKMIGMAIGFAV